MKATREKMIDALVKWDVNHILAAKMTAADLVRVHSADVLFKAHMAHPEVLSLRYAFAAAHGNDLIKAAA